MKLFALAIMAVHPSGRTSVAAGYTSRATSKEEAVGTGIRLANEEFPITQGWGSHSCSVLEIPPEVYRGEA